MPRRFIHAADLHLDSPFAGLGALREGLDEILRDASLDAWDALVQRCIDEDVEFLLLAGDLFDRGEGSVRGRARLRDGVARLHEADIRTFVVAGNHDALSTPSPLAGVAGATVFRATSPDAVTCDPRGLGPVIVHGMSFATRSVTDNLASRFTRGDEAGFHVGLLHCTVGGARDGHDPYAPCVVQDLLDARMDYWALGHIHRHLVEHEDPPIVYAGTLQGRSPKPAERGSHGAVLVEFDGARVIGMSPIELDRVRFEAIDVPIDDLVDEAALVEALRAAADRVTAEADGRLVLLRATLVGNGALHARLAADGYLEELRRELDADADVVWERVRSAAGPAIDLDGLRTANPYAAELLDAFEGLAADPAALSALLDELAQPFTDAALNGLAEEDPAARLVAARDLAVALLAAQQGDGA